MRKGDIYYIDLDNRTSGYLQAGKRPVVIVQNNKGNEYSPTTIVCPLTTQKKKPMPTHVFIGREGGLTQNSTVTCEQIFTVNKSELLTYVGTITNPLTLHRLDIGLLISLGLSEGVYYGKGN
jgi:mRNA-degrading endonuclease toxin of MazEF toxin-antitoxin module